MRTLPASVPCTFIVKLRHGQVWVCAWYVLVSVWTGRAGWKKLERGRALLLPRLGRGRVCAFTFLLNPPSFRSSQEKCC